MKARLVGFTQPSSEFASDFTDAKDLIAFCARVSNPTNQYNNDTADKLLGYLKKHKHWSPFEMASATVEIETTRDIARQLLRHRSFSFQEFCIAGDSLITLELPNSIKNKKRASYKRTIEHLYKLQQTGKLPSYVRVFDEESSTFVLCAIKEVFKTGVKPVFKITLENGKTITTTKEHKFLTDNGFQTLEEAVGLSMRGDLAAMTKVAFIGCNGVPLSRVHWSQVKHIEYVGEQMTYDMEVDHVSHNYVANGIVTHNSQRYADPVEELSFVIREARLQDDKNRQNSIDLTPTLSNDLLQKEWSLRQKQILDLVEENYKWAIDKKIAKEQARVILPEGLTKSRLYVNGTIRSYIHYVDVRTDVATQKEHRELALAVAQAINQIFPFFD